jgi:hypothetical protein
VPASLVNSMLILSAPENVTDSATPIYQIEFIVSIKYDTIE